MVWKTSCAMVKIGYHGITWWWTKAQEVKEVTVTFTRSRAQHKQQFFIFIMQVPVGFWRPQRTVYTICRTKSRRKTELTVSCSTISMTFARFLFSRLYPLPYLTSYFNSRSAASLGFASAASLEQSFSSTVGSSYDVSLRLIRSYNAAPFLKHVLEEMKAEEKNCSLIKKSITNWPLI